MARTGAENGEAERRDCEQDESADLAFALELFGGVRHVSYSIGWL